MYYLPATALPSVRAEFVGHALRGAPMPPPASAARKGGGASPHARLARALELEWEPLAPRLWIVVAVRRANRQPSETAVVSYVVFLGLL